MSMKRHVCRSGRNVKPFVEHIWISDDVLNVAVQRFGRFTVSKRSVVLAPGPLEARKRETKRRLAHISQATGGMPGSIDPSLLAGVNQRAREGQWHWQAPGVSDQSEPLALPSWLTDLIHYPTVPSIPARRQDRQAADLRLCAEQQEIPSRLQEHAFLSRLDHCQNLNELRDLASFFEIDVRKHSRKAFRQLYKAERSLQTCLDFLEDTSLDDPWAQNLRYLLSELSHQLKDQIDNEPSLVASILRSILFPWVKSQLSLGKRSRADIVELGIFVRNLARNKAYELFRRDFARVILEGLRSSTVLTFGDLTPSNRAFLLKTVWKGELSFDLQDLGLSLAETVEDSALISQFLAKCIHSQPASHGLKEVQAWQQEIYPRICKFLQARSQADANFIVRSTSRYLVEWQSRLPHSSLRCASLMDQWWSTIAKTILPNFLTHGLGSLNIESLMQSSRPDTLASYANHLGGRKKARFVFSNWFTGRLSIHGLEKASAVLQENLEKESKDPPFLCMLRTAHENQLLDDDFVQHSFQMLSRMRMYGVMTEILMRTRDSDIHIPPNVVLATIRHLLTISPKLAHRIFRCDPRIPLESLPTLAEKLIQHPKLHPNTVWNYQRQRSWQSAMNALGVKVDFQRKSRTRLLDAMALAYSKTPHITSRVAHRHVMRCFHRYRNENLGPMSLRVSRALVRTGVIRPLQEENWVSRELLTFVLSVVREVEGPARADDIDHIVHAWRRQLRQQKKPMWDLERLILLREGPSRFVFRRKWSPIHKRYDRVILPAREWE